MQKKQGGETVMMKFQIILKVNFIFTRACSLLCQVFATPNKKQALVFFQVINDQIPAL